MQTARYNVRTIEAGLEYGDAIVLTRLIAIVTQLDMQGSWIPVSAIG